MRAGFTVSAATSSSSVVPQSMARRAALAKPPTSFRRTVLAAVGTPACSNSARFVGASAQCSSSRSGTASTARGVCTSGVRGKSNGTTTGRAAARTSARRRYSRPLPTMAASSFISRASASARSRLRSSPASNHTRSLPAAAACSAVSALASTGGSLPAGCARHTSSHCACHAASANVCRWSAMAPMSAPGYVARSQASGLSSLPPVVSNATQVPAFSSTVRAARGSSPSRLTCALPRKMPAFGWIAAAVKPSARSSLRWSAPSVGRSAARTCGTTLAFQCAPFSPAAARAAAELSTRTHASMKPG